jgi:hypothetical protein
MDIDIQHVLYLLKTDEEFSKNLYKRNPQLESDIISFRLNPECDCKSNIVKYLENCDLKEHEFINQWIKELPSRHERMQQDTLNSLMSERARMALKHTLPQLEWKNYKDVIGEVVEIEPNPDKYKEMMSIAREKWFYNGLNVTETLKTDPTTGNEKVVWLVFFY